MVNKVNRKILANALRLLSVDSILVANSGHPGMPLGMADIAEVLWRDFLKHNPNNPEWINRDRFILSNGHGAILQYALLHLTGYELTIEDLKKFRQLHSKTPGHPEYGVTKGVAATTGPLGQGLAMAVGMALAEQLLARIFNRHHFEIIDHYTYCFAGDGCLMEGISHEVCSLAGTLGLHKLIVFWDNNNTSIDGNTKNWFTEDVAKRFTSYNWHVIDNINGHSSHDLITAIKLAKAQTNKPSLLCCNTVIGYGSPNFAGSYKCHGTPFTAQEILAIRNNLSWDFDPFVIPEEIYQAWNFNKQGKILNSSWDALFSAYSKKYPELAGELQRRMVGNLPEKIDVIIKELLLKTINNSNTVMNIATRQSAKIFLDDVAHHIPELFGGSADLSISNGTQHSNAVAFNIDHTNKHSNKIFNYLNYGVREFGMFAILNGMALHKGFIPYGGTFLVFADYGKSAIRLSALMRQKVIYIFTHDSIGVGEDGPTHQPVEQLATLRMIPNLSVWRPCDTVETIVAWQQALYYDGPSALALSRQNVAQQHHVATTVNNIINNIKLGGYIIYQPPVAVDDASKIQAIIVATGSEVALAIQAAKDLANHLVVRVVSMPNLNIFLKQAKDYQAQILPPTITARVAVEAGSTIIWHKIVGTSGTVIGVDSFGCSANYKDLYQEFNLTTEAIKTAILAIVR